MVMPRKGYVVYIADKADSVDRIVERCRSLQVARRKAFKLNQEAMAKFGLKAPLYYAGRVGDTGLSHLGDK